MAQKAAGSECAKQHAADKKLHLKHWSELTYTRFTPENLWGYDPSLPGTLDCVQILTLALKQFFFHPGGFDTTTKVSPANNSGLSLYGAVRKI